MLDPIEMDAQITHEMARGRSGMRIVMEPPPNLAAIGVVFPTVPKDCFIRGIFFAWGNTIYNPSGAHIPLEILAHEAVHSIQQEQAGGPEDWWEEYLACKEFRFDQELLAHQIEWQDVLFQNANRHARRRYIVFMAERLSGPLYGRMTTKDKAKRLIQEKQDGPYPVYSM